MSRETPPPPEECAQCGATIPPRARACPECGADERTGWRESSIYDGMDLPDEAFGDERDRVPQRAAGRRTDGTAWYWLAAGILLLLMLGFGALGLLR